MQNAVSALVITAVILMAAALALSITTVIWENYQGHSTLLRVLTAGSLVLMFFPGLGLCIIAATAKP